MLGWMLKRGDNAPDAVDAGGTDTAKELERAQGKITLTLGLLSDTTQLDQPDTPAPVFAARAFKSALFGTSGQPSDQPQNKRAKPPVTKTTAQLDQVSDTPSKPQGILLTPGTGTSRRKRVSFGHDVPKTNPASSNDALTGSGEVQKRTRLNDALEKARKTGTTTKTSTRQSDNDLSDSDWEEADDDDYCNHDITLDLNEPHSQSGRYWKSELEKYHEDAKAEMEKLLNYKQMAKSYARQKDAEAIQLAEKLKTEQQKVVKMEKKIADNASHIVAKSRNTMEDTSPGSLAKLTKQTALAVQYRQRVQELEGQLEEFLRDKEDDGESKGRRRRHVASPRTHNTLMETQRELRRARAQVKELGDLREEVTSLKAQLRSAEKQGASNDGGSGRAQDLRAQLRQSREECKAKDDELRQLKAEFDAFRQESQVHEKDTRAVLERAHTKIADLKKEVKTLKTAAPEPPQPKSWQPQHNNDEPKVEMPMLKADTLASRSNSRSLGQRSFDIADLEGDESVEIPAPPANSKSLREKYHDKEGSTAALSSGSSRVVSSALADRPNLEKPRWQPFVPRSPRNRAYLGEKVASRLQHGGVTPMPAKRVKDAGANDLSALAKSMARSKREPSADVDDPEVDLLQDRFVRLGGPDTTSNQSSAVPAKKSTLPPERRAAALARIEQRMAEKKRGQRRSGFDKENMRPLST